MDRCKTKVIDAIIQLSDNKDRNTVLSEWRSGGRSNATQCVCGQRITDRYCIISPKGDIITLGGQCFKKIRYDLKKVQRAPRELDPLEDYVWP